jgi:hypothetical protein
MMSWESDKLSQGGHHKIKCYAATHDVQTDVWFLRLIPRMLPKIHRNWMLLSTLCKKSLPGILLQIIQWSCAIKLHSTQGHQRLRYAYGQEIAL